MEADRRAALDWKAVAATYRVLPGTEVLAMSAFERHQTIRDRVSWLRPEEPPVALVFVSHRWETLRHPDPDGRQCRAVRRFLELVCAGVESMLVARDERLALVPSVTTEGPLQASELARRILGFGPFADSMAGVGGRRARAWILERWGSGSDGAAFRAWLAGRIGVWIDYCCMPQKPLSPEEEPAFREALASLGALVRSATVLSLRTPEDDYPQRGWCAAEYFLGSGRSFAKGLYVDLHRLEAAAEAELAPRPAVRDESDRPLAEAYDADRADFEQACAEWTSTEAAMVDVTPTAPWSAYRWLWGSSSPTPERDPNPFRRLMSAVVDLEKRLLRDWLMSSDPLEVDVAGEAGAELARHGLRSSDPDDLGYLGVLAAAHGWVAPVRALFEAALARYSTWRGDGGRWRCWAELHPLTERQRALFGAVRPSSADTWYSRLTTGAPGDEKPVLDELQSSWATDPPRFTLIDDDPSPSA